jgi:hypothetical protein
MDKGAGIGVMDGLVQAAVAYGLTIAVAMAAAGLIWLIVMTLEAMKKKEKAATAPTSVQIAVAPEPEQVDETARHVAAVAAAVYATLGAARLVYIGEGAHSPAWTSTGRTIHQTSHMPKRAPKR